MVTDPPYGVAYGTWKTPRCRRKDNKQIRNDNLGAAQYDFWVAGLRHWALEGDAYVFGPSGPLNILMARAIDAAGIEHHQSLIWVKDAFVLGRSHYHYRHEHIFYGWKGKSSWGGRRTENSVWECDRPSRSPEHPTIKPVALVALAIQNSSVKGAIVLDPFLGSGTTMVAAEQLGRLCFAMEIDVEYAAVSLERMAEMGLEPRLAAGQTQ